MGKWNRNFGEQKKYIQTTNRMMNQLNGRNPVFSISNTYMCANDFLLGGFNSSEKY